MRSSQWTSAPAAVSAARQRVELRVGADPQAGVGLAGGREALVDADVQLRVADGEPHAAAAQPLRLLELAQPEQAAVEAARLALAAGRRGDLDVVEPVDHERTSSGS